MSGGANGRTDAPRAAVLRRLRAARQAHLAANLRVSELGWRHYPGDGDDPARLSEYAIAREVAIDAEVARRLPAGASAAGAVGNDAVAAARLRHSVKHFPVLFISAPHVREGVNGSFPGLPTPLLYATAVLDRLLRIDEFPASRVPEVIAVLNPPAYSDGFERELTAHLRRHRPVMVGMSNLSEGHHFALRIARIIKRISPQSLVLFGGQHEDAVNAQAYASAADRAGRLTGRQRAVHSAFELTAQERARLAGLQTLANPADRAVVDFVIAGDAPYALVELLRVVADHPDRTAVGVKDALRAARQRFAELPGSGSLSFHDDHARRIEVLPLSGEPLDGNLLPFIDLGRLTHENRYDIFGNRLTAQIMACVGCKYACAFCHESADSYLYDVPKIRQRRPGHVAQEIALRVEQGYATVFFDDSTFTQNPAWLAEFLPLLRAPGSGAPIVEWGCQTTINDVDYPMLRRMAAAGCSYIYFGIESSAPPAHAVQKVQQLRVKARETGWGDRFRQVAAWCKQAGIRVGTSLQFGLGESAEQRLETFALIADLHSGGIIPDGCVALNINTPYPGTRQWLDLVRSGARLPDYRAELERHPAFETAHQFSTISGAEAQEVFAVAVANLGSAVHSGAAAKAEGMLVAPVPGQARQAGAR